MGPAVDGPNQKQTALTRAYRDAIESITEGKEIEKGLAQYLVFATTHELNCAWCPRRLQTPGFSRCDVEMLSLID